jgi:hypothetical protein
MPFLATAGAVLERDGVTVVGVASSIAQALRQVGRCNRTLSWLTSGWARRAALTWPGWCGMKTEALR